MRVRRFSLTVRNCPYRSRGPLGGAKAALAEGGVRVPFILRWPGKVGAGTICRQPVMSFDLYPTLLAASGASVSAGTSSDGINLLPFLAGNRNGASPHGDLFWKVSSNAASFLHSVSRPCVWHVR